MVNRIKEFLSIAVAIIVIDQILKNIFLKLTEPIYVVGDVIKFNFIKNFGASFGILKNQKWLFIIFSLIVMIAIIYYYKRMPKDYIPWVAMIMGGTLSNLIDRIHLGFVIDYIDLTYWPVFNIADIALTAGAIVLIWKIAKEKEK